jgi:tetratricopeptide (TPR) repeat protein
MPKFAALLAATVAIAISSPAAYSATNTNSVHGATSITPVLTAQDSGEALFNRAIEKYQKKDFQGALADINEFIRLNPKFALAYVLRGDIKDDMKDPQGAIADYTKAISLDSKQYLAHYNRAITYTNLEKFPEAIADYKKAIAIKPDYAPAYRNLGLLKFMTGTTSAQKEAGMADVKKAITLYEQQGNSAKAEESKEILKKMQEQR